MGQLEQRRSDVIKGHRVPDDSDEHGVLAVSSTCEPDRTAAPKGPSYLERSAACPRIDSGLLSVASLHPLASALPPTKILLASW